MGNRDLELRRGERAGERRVDVARDDDERRDVSSESETEPTPS
jgi:hypothetical protein